MPRNDDLADLYSAIEQSARLLNIPCSHDKVWPILTAYRSALGEDAVIAFRVATGKSRAGELDFRFTVPKTIDPYAVALSSGLTAATDHPVGALLADIQERCPVESYGIDFGIVGGFKKVGPFFPPADMPLLSALAEIPSMPRSLAENTGLFSSHGLDEKVSLVGIDYKGQTVNIYFGELAAECVEPAAIRSMLRAIDLPDPSDQLLRLARKSFGIYATLSWNSARVERIAFAVMGSDLAQLPVALEPEIELFANSAPCAATGRRFVYAVSPTPHGEYYKLQSYYRWRPEMADRMLLPESAEDLV
jgi:hypothetical protein